MLRTGDVLVHPDTGQEFRFVRTAADTGGELLVLETVLPAGGGEPPPHYHPFQHERFTVLDGHADVLVDGERRRVTARDVVEVPPGAVHEMSGDATLRWEVWPALRTEAFFETFVGLAQERRTNGNGMPGPLQLAVFAHEFRDELRIAALPWALQRPLLALLARAGRLLGRPATLSAAPAPA
jgi:quercetin dioxygenase-like cupin family protein